MVRADVHRAFAGVELILHAGDVGGDEILDELALIAPVPRCSATRTRPAIHGCRRRSIASIGGVTHPRESTATRWAARRRAKLLERYAADVIVYGHTHQQLVARADERLVVNPGAAGARRFKLAPSVALLRIADGRADVELINLD